MQYKVMAAFWLLKNKYWNVFLLQVVCARRIQYKQIEIWMNINGYVKRLSFCQNVFLLSSKLIHVHVQYVY